MSDLTFNKIAGAVLATGLAIFFLREVSDVVFEKEPVEKPGYAITVAETTEGGAAAGPELPPDWGTVIPAADVAAGKTVTAKCASCHNFEPGGPNGTGPDLYGVLGRKPGSHAGFAYSAAMTEFGASHPQWGWDEINEFVAAPQKHIPGTKMTFVGLKKVEDRVALIAYLHTLGSSLAVPAPKPAAAAPAEAGAPVSVEGAAAGPAQAPGAPTETPAATPAKPH